MCLNKLWQHWGSQPAASRRSRAATVQRRPLRLRVKQLEDRTVPSGFTAGTVADLIADIKAANTGGGSNTITLVAGTTFTLTAVDNTTDGATGLPVIAANDTLTIVGNNDTIQRSTAKGTPAYRLFDVAGGASLILESMTVQNGLAQGNGAGASSAEGGAIYSQGTLALNTVTVQNSTAQGYFAGTAAGGGIYSGGSLTVQSSTVRNNQALGGLGLTGRSLTGGGGGAGGSAFGGGLYIGGGTATLTSATVSSNTARGGDGGMAVCPFGGTRPHGASGGNGGNGLGGGLYAAGGTIDLHNVIASGNTAAGGAGGQGITCGSKAFGGFKGSPGLSEGGGLYIDPAAAVCLDAFTQSNVKKNHASTNYPDIDGAYTTCQ
jgi:hypothetical protein